MEVGATYLVLIMCLVQQITAGFGPAAWQLAESNSSNSYITNVRTTMKIPSLPSQQGLLYWPGLYTEDGWLVQSIIGNEVDYLEEWVNNHLFNIPKRRFNGYTASAQEVVRTISGVHSRTPTTQG